MSQTRRSAAFVVVMVFALSACATGGDTGGTGNTDRDIPVVDIGACQTSQGTARAAEPRGVDWRTQLREQGVLHIGSDNAYPPFEEIPPGADEPVGFDVDLYTEIAERMGLEARSTTTAFETLFTQSIPNGRFDLGVSAITITEERRGSVDFTIPYFQSDLSLAVNTQRTPDIATIDDLEGKAVGVQTGTTGEACAKHLEDGGQVGSVRTYDDAGLAFQDLVQGRVVAVVNDAPASQGFVDKNSDLQVVQIIRTNEQYGMAISKDKPDLREEIDKHMREIMEDGTYARIYEKWFETEPPFDVPLD